MPKNLRPLLLLLCLCISGHVAHTQGEPPKALFLEDSPLDITIRMPLEQVINDRITRDEHEAMLVVSSAGQ